PNWVIASLQITEGHPASRTATFSVQATASTSENSAAPLSFAWQRNCGTGFVDLPGANEATYTFSPAASEHGCRYRCLLFTPGATAISAVATLTLALPPLSIDRSATNVRLSWPVPAVPQTSESPTGPWTSVNNASNPFTVFATGRQFYRLS